MAKKLGVSPHRIAVSQHLRPDVDGELRPASKGLPIKAAVVEASRPPKAEEED